MSPSEWDFLILASICDGVKEIIQQRYFRNRDGKLSTGVVPVGDEPERAQISIMPRPIVRAMMSVPGLTEGRLKYFVTDETTIPNCNMV